MIIYLHTRDKYNSILYPSKIWEADPLAVYKFVQTLFAESERRNKSKHLMMRRANVCCRLAACCLTRVQESHAWSRPSARSFSGKFLQ